MTMEECYREMGGDYKEVNSRLPGARMIERFALRFLEDPSYWTLCRELDAGNREEAFRAAHTLKGVCANLGFTRLRESVSQLTEELRPKSDAVPVTAALIEHVKADYEVTVDAIRKYQNGQ